MRQHLQANWQLYAGLLCFLLASVLQAISMR